MTRYNVGIDFGTHQTKICIEDSLNKRVPVYEFLEFHNSYGASSVLFPSIIQINKDDSISYGFVDPTQAKILSKDGCEPPKRREVAEPTYISLPVEPKYDSIPKKPESKHNSPFAALAFLLPKSEEEKQWEIKCNSLKRANENRKLAWKFQVQKVEKQNEEIKKEWESECQKAEQEYIEIYNQWQRDMQKCEHLRFRYFKQASFCSFDWQHSISPMTLSVWYMTYVYFCIIEKIGYDFTVQMGAPMGANIQLSEQQRSVAKKIWASACELANKYKSKNEFLKTTVDELKKNTIIISGDKSRVSVLPEASAGLLAIRHRLGHGMFLLVDIGGGTTDVGMCSVCDKQGNKVLGIHRVYSFNKGLNYVFEEYQKQHPKWSLSEIQDLFWEDETKEDFAEAMSNYKQDLHSQLMNLVSQIISSFRSRQNIHNLSVEQSLVPAMNKKPIILCGGGSIFEKMRNFSTENLYFSDKRLINASLLRIDNLANTANIPKEFYPMLATAYGLSKQVDINEELDEKPLEMFFHHIQPMESPRQEERTQENDYSLAMGCS